MIIHCGSRYLGSDVAKYYMGKAQREYESNFIEKNMIINDYKSKGKERELKVKLDTLKNRSIEKK